MVKVTLKACKIALYYNKEILSNFYQKMNFQDILLKFMNYFLN